jgi:hypothetical protein
MRRGRKILFEGLSRRERWIGGGGENGSMNVRQQPVPLFCGFEGAELYGAEPGADLAEDFVIILKPKVACRVIGRYDGAADFATFVRGFVHSSSVAVSHALSAHYRILRVRPVLWVSPGSAL